MKIRLFFVTLLLSFFSLSALDGWKTVETVSVDGTTVKKETMVFEDIMKVVNTTKNGGNETIIDLKADKITLINHFDKTYQVIKLSEYIKFAEGMLKELTAQGRINPDKVPPKIEYQKVATESVGQWTGIHYTVLVDGKPYADVWVAPELKDSSLVSFQEKFASLMPSSLTKYRSLDTKIREHLSQEGLIVRQIKHPFVAKLPTVEQTLVSFKKVVRPLQLIVIPQGYTIKNAAVK